MRSPVKIFCTVLAFIAAVFSGCDSGADPVKSTEAELKSLSVGGITAEIPAAITGTVWDDAAQTLGGLAAEYTKTIEFPAGADMTGLTITAKGSEKAKVEFAARSNDTRPASSLFQTTDKTAALSPPAYLYIRVTAEDNSYRNYYRFSITKKIPVTGIAFDEDTTRLTIGYRGKLAHTITPPNATNKNITWVSSDSNVVSVDEDGTVTAVGFTSGGTTRFSNGGTTTNPNTFPATGTATITATTADGGFTDTITVTATMEALVDIMDLPPLKDQFANYFMIGNIARSSGDITGSGTSAAISQARLTRHYNILTSENNMKPQNMTSARNTSTGAITYTWTNADNFVNAAENAGLKVVGHTLLWHSQNPNWVWSQIASQTGTAVASKEAALAAMRAYIAAVAGRYKGRIYSWDVLNEAFPDNASSSANWKDAIRKNASGEGQDANPWYVAIGSDFVYEGFLAARLADPGAILYYNDYNTDMPNRARLIRDMVQEVNAKYLTGGDKPAGEAPGRLLIEGIGMQEHHNNGITAARIRTTINTFRPLGVKLAVTELDIIAVPQYNDLGGSGANNNHNAANVTNNTLLIQARLYGEYMNLYLENADIIERVSLWGITDNTSWRSRGLPLLFDHNGRAKPAYYRFTAAIGEFEASQ
jgi:endo-1,4-beta-xylanase